MHKTTTIMGACLLAASLAGCSGSNDFKPTEGMGASELFKQACSTCHGENGNGKFGFLLKIADSEAPLQEIVDKIHNGGHVMPAFPNISEADALAVAGYLKGQ
jgi:mono/diheme cytochrome c family protein